MTVAQRVHLALRTAHEATPLATLRQRGERRGIRIRIRTQHDVKLLRREFGHRDRVVRGEHFVHERIAVE